ncbi:hypothetical protein EV188_104145 [Actinomycetospora succinea]|uniref:Uncharacterized protein n=1 Tax=Actinomycetospora succinea TaxID=663603 RepID=A0A4R6V9V0_9PSEU|nr:hypothetical protein [Actinomycetospora succinea]TDQ58405.1 hypothetical protein EV188_104145 [Actinomycetospora succinea]
MSSPYGGGDVDRAVTGAHADYHREIQQHVEPDGLVDDVVTYRMLAPHLMRTLLFLVTPTVLLLLKVVLDYLASMSTPDDVTDIVSTLLGLVVVVLYIAGIASFFAPAKEPIAEHSRLLENRGDVATSAFEYVRAAAEARQSPAEVAPSTVAGVPVLLFRQYSERAMLLVQPYGRDLYVGWTMWRSRSTATLLAHFLRDTFGRFAPAPRFSAELRAAATRALRESVHSLSREGVAAATHLGAPAAQSPASGPFPQPETHHPERPAPPREHPQPQPQPQPQQQPHYPDEAPDALPTSGPYRPAGTDTGGWSTPRRGAEHEEHDDRDERVTVRREPRRREADEGWGPPPRDRW